MEKEQLHQGLALLRKPVLPLATMVEFFLSTGDFSTAAEIIDQLPAPIETEYANYERPAELLAPYIDQLDWLLAVHNGAELPLPVINEAGERIERSTAAIALANQQILTRELETINSLLCAPCGCSLCCIGPEQGMQQAFFEIPLQAEEKDLFAVRQVATPASGRSRSMDTPPLQVEGTAFYQRETAALIHWQTGWSLILPTDSRCPNLEPENGRCRVYPVRPEVCRRPQIFPYIVEPVLDGEGKVSAQRLRGALLAVVDCPYVQALQEEIAAYAAACELELVLKHNKG